MSTVLSKDLFEPKPIGRLTVIHQTVIIAGLFLILTAKYYLTAKSHGNLGEKSTFPIAILFAPIYEEVIFRGALLGYFENVTSKVKAVVIVSLLFGIWHIKNVFWFEPRFVAEQVLYTSLFFSPIVCLTTLRFRSIWPGVMLHFINNILF